MCLLNNRSVLENEVFGFHFYRVPFYMVFFLSAVLRYISIHFYVFLLLLLLFDSELYRTNNDKKAFNDILFPSIREHLITIARASENWLCGKVKSNSLRSSVCFSNSKRFLFSFRFRLWLQSFAFAKANRFTLQF